MKYSEDTEEHQQANRDYVKERWRQLYEVQEEWGTEAIKYLFLVNSGAAAAMLAFMGSVSNARDMVWPKVMLGVFALGIVLIGFMHALRHRHISMLFKKWRESVNEYYTEQKGWGDIIQEDIARSARFDGALLMAYMSLACFVTGVVIGIVNFPSLNNGENNGRKETNITCTCSQTKCPEATNNDKGFSRGQCNEGNAKQPTTSTNPKKEIR